MAVGWLAAAMAVGLGAGGVGPAALAVTACGAGLLFPSLSRNHGTAAAGGAIMTGLLAMWWLS
jgi:hypothetical protein